MKPQIQRAFGQRGFTLVEMLMTTAVVGITGSVLFYILYTGLILFAKNTGINLAHQQARAAVIQMEQELHAAISVPQMTDINRVALTGAAASGPAAGLSFQLFAGGPFKVAATAAASQSQIQVLTNGFTPLVGMRLIIPTHQIEQSITAVSTAGNTSTLTLATALPVVVSTTLNSLPVNVVCFITDRVAYVVQNNQLLYYGTIASGSFKVMANDITTATPFSVPSTPLGAPYTRFVAAINLSTSDLAYGNLNFKAANMFLNAMESCRAQLCQIQ